MTPPKVGTGTNVATRGQSSEFVTHSTLQDELNKFRSDLTSSLNDYTNKTVNRGVDVLQASIVAKVSQVEDDVKSPEITYVIEPSICVYQAELKVPKFCEAR